MLVSDVSDRDLAGYLRLEYEDLTGDEKKELNVMLAAAKGYIKSYTGLTDEQVDMQQELVIALYVLVQDMYDNRSLYVDSGNLNKAVETILGMHSINLL